MNNSRYGTSKNMEFSRRNVIIYIKILKNSKEILPEKVLKQSIQVDTQNKLKHIT